MNISFKANYIFALYDKPLLYIEKYSRSLALIFNSKEQMLVYRIYQSKQYVGKSVGNLFCFVLALVVVVVVLFVCLFVCLFLFLLNLSILGIDLELCIAIRLNAFFWNYPDFSTLTGSAATVLCSYLCHHSSFDIISEKENRWICVIYAKNICCIKIRFSWKTRHQCYYHRLRSCDDYVLNPAK